MEGGGGGHGAGWRGRREGASAGGFEEQPRLLWIRISPDAGGGPRGAATVPTGRGGRWGLGGLTNRSTYRHLKKADKYLR